MSEVVPTKSQEEYEDDFEKDLDWLISEESQNEEQGPDDVDLEAEIDRELEDEKQGVKSKDKGSKQVKKGKKPEQKDEDEDRWPPPMDPLDYDSESDSLSTSPSIVPPPPDMNDQTDEEKKYIQEKIQQANRELQDQEAPDMTRRRRLQFKETLVDLVVPPLHFDKNTSVEAQAGEDVNQPEDNQVDVEVSGKLSELKLSPREDREDCGGSSRAKQSSGGAQGLREGRVLVEKDGKFDLVSLKEVESQGLLPPITNGSGSSPQVYKKTANSTNIHRFMSSACLHSGSSSIHQSVDHLRAPRPPSQPRNRPSSAGYFQRRSQINDSRRRVKSATGTCLATYTLSPEQKEMLQKVRERKEKLAREAEQRKLEEEQVKRQENEVAFKAWLMRKRLQLQEERRIHRAQDLERENSKKESSDPEEAFKMWLQRKQEQQQREKQLEELKRLEEDGGYLLHSREECERAFKLWLKRKRLEKRVEQQVAREQSRRLVLEERRARRMRDLLCTANENKPFRFTEQLAYSF
ncbi:coiled-coil domain-containing protein 181 [Gouania willdenowi]|uniref:Coiled-coil domain-containing protein 181 n=1 Tax=Gouania willdenowi TaxID=441366 RepID=A0A8C5NHI6_GOUWI|nr:coiled-coil domain-containing protein 181 [Gouania willdenowi]